MSDTTSSKPFDAYAQSPEHIQAPPKTFGRALLKIGPGLILAGAIVGTGELIATTNVGAKVGFALLWLVIISCFLKVFVQVELGRHAVSTGETTLLSLKKIPYVGTFFTYWWLLMMLGTQSQMAAMIGGTAQSIHRLAPSVAPLFAGEAHAHLFWSAMVAVATSIVLALGSYKMVEVFTTFMVVGFTAVTVASVAFLPAGSVSSAEVASGMAFQIPPGAAVVAFAMFGITGVGAAELVAYPYWCIEKGYARYVGPRDSSDSWAARAQGWLRVMQLDAWVSMFVYTVATLAFYTLGASILHKHDSGGLPGTVEEMLRALSRMYEPMLGPQLAAFFISAGALAVLYSTLFSATAANSRALADFFQVNGLTVFNAAADRQRWIRRLVIAFPLLDLALYAFVKNPVALVTFGAVGQALTLPMLAFGALYLRFRRSDERLRPGPVWDVLLVFSTVAFCLTAAYVMYDTWTKLAK